MKKAFVLFIGIFLLGLTGICVLPGYILKEADNVTLSEQVILGDKAIVEGVTVNTANDSMRHLLWNTEFLVGRKPVTEFEFSAKRRTAKPMLRGEAWMAQSDYSCIVLSNRMSGGWSSSSTGSVNLEGGLIEESGLVEAYKRLATETAPGKELSRQIFLSQYMEYFPVAVTVHGIWSDEALSKAYAEFFKIPVPKDATYTISIRKNQSGNITQAEGRPGEQNIFTWRSVSARSEDACYFTFYHYTLDGTRIDTGMIPGGFGVYRQPYALGAEGVYMNPEELSMVYSLEEENYPHGSIFLDVNAAGQLLVITDTETTTKLQVVDLTTFEKVQQIEVLRPEWQGCFESVVRVKDNFLLLSYGDGYYTLIDWNEERGYEHQFSVQVSEDDPLYWGRYTEQSDMDWNGSRLLYVSCTDRQYMQGSCDFTLAVYDASGKIYQGEYKSSLLTEQERECLYAWNSVEPWDEIPISVSWPLKKAE